MLRIYKRGMRLYLFDKILSIGVLVTFAIFRLATIIQLEREAGQAKRNAPVVETLLTQALRQAIENL